MTYQMRELLEIIYFYKNREIIENIVIFGTENALVRIRNNKNKKEVKLK